MQYISQGQTNSYIDFITSLEAKLEALATPLTTTEHDSLLAIYNTSSASSYVPISEVSAFLATITTLTTLESDGIKALTKIMPTELPVSIQEVKTFLSIEGDLTTGLEAELLNEIKTAIKFGEDYFGLVFIITTYRLYLDKFPLCENPIELKKSKLQSVIDIFYTLESTKQSLVNTKYYTTISNFYSSIFLNKGEVYPCVDDKKQIIEIDFTAGFAINSLSTLPGHKMAILSAISIIRGSVGDCATKSNIKEKIYSTYKSISSVSILSAI
tara:strand:- start:13199 stop:14008 length:810 start_codon:yes stop_codon:yes gene_type:complete